MKNIESSKIGKNSSCNKIFSKLLNTTFLVTCRSVLNYCVFKSAKNVRLEPMEGGTLPVRTKK